MARVIYLRPDGDEIGNALTALAADEIRSVNSLALEILAGHLRATGYLE